MVNKVGRPRRNGVEPGHGSGHYARREMDPAEVERSLRSVPPDTRSMLQRFMGDPLPGRSAYDIKKAKLHV